MKEIKKSSISKRNTTNTRNVSVSLFRCDVKGNVCMVVKFTVLELYIMKCLEKGLKPTWQGLKAYQK